MTAFYATLTLLYDACGQTCSQPQTEISVLTYKRHMYRTYTCVCICMCMCVCVFVHLCVRARARVCVCVCVCVYVTQFSQRD